MTVVHILAPPETARAVVAALPGRRCVVWDDPATAPLADAELLVAASLPAGARARLTRLRWLLGLSSGVDHLLPGLPAAAQLVRITGVHEAAVSEHAWALALALSRQIATAVIQQEARVWRRPPMLALAGGTLAVLGLGAIGARIAAVGSALGMHVLGTRNSAGVMPGVAEIFPPSSTRAVLARADLVFVALPRTPATLGLLDADMLACMRPGALLVVVGRGGIVDEAALVERLRGGQLAGAALDVSEVEPPPADSPLWSAPHLLLTPHVAGWSADMPRRLARAVAMTVENIDRGDVPAGLVDRARGY